MSNQRTFKPLEGGRLIDSDGKVWRLMTQADFDEGRESVVVYSPDTFEFNRYTPCQ